jgi:predicted nucleic acid-binding protein
MTAVLDTNVLLRHLVNEDSDQARRASEYMSRIRAGDVRVLLPITVLFEANYVLRNTYGLSRAQVIDILEPLVSWRSLDITDRRSAGRAFEIYREYNISFADAYHAALAEGQDPPQLVTFDRLLSRVKTIERIEP